MDQAYLAQLNNWRYISENEIIIEIDNPEISWEEMNNTCWMLNDDKYAFSLWYANGQRSGHLRIFIAGLELLDKETRQRYKEEFIKKYCPKGDLALCTDNHLIAEENKAHYKYKTIKQRIGQWNIGKVNFIDKEILGLCTENVINERKIKEVKFSKKTGLTAKISQRVNILDIAKLYGFEIKKNKAVCLFHKDDNPSLRFYPDTATFKCYGCKRQGNIIEFVKQCKLAGFVKNG